MKHEGVGDNILVHSIPSYPPPTTIFFLIHQTEHQEEHASVLWPGNLQQNRLEDEGIPKSHSHVVNLFHKFYFFGLNIFFHLFLLVSLYRSSLHFS